MRQTRIRVRRPRQVFQYLYKKIHSKSLRKISESHQENSFLRVILNRKMISPMLKFWNKYKRAAMMKLTKLMISTAQKIVTVQEKMKGRPILRMKSKSNTKSGPRSRTLKTKYIIAWREMITQLRLKHKKKYITEKKTKRARKTQLRLLNHIFTWPKDSVMSCPMNKIHVEGISPTIAVHFLKTIGILKIIIDN